VSERDAAALNAVVTVSRAFAGEADLATILDLVAKQGRAVVGARALAIEVREDGGMVVAAVAGELPEGVDAARESAESAVLVIPLALRGRAYGALVAVDRQSGGPRFTVEDEEMLEALATLAAGAVAAQKLHRAQRPPALDHVGLTGAIELLADLVESPEVEIRTRLDLAFGEGRAENRLDGKVETAAYRIVQEALTSIVKCPEASQVLVEVVEDDGRGELKIEVRASGGEETRVTATLPSGRRRRSMLNID
jgi:signal transduction histidine kinase